MKKLNQKVSAVLNILSEVYWAEDRCRWNLYGPARKMLGHGL